MVQYNDTEAGFDNMQALMYGVLDCSIFAQQFNTLAEMRPGMFIILAQHCLMHL